MMKTLLAADGVDSVACNDRCLPTKWVSNSDCILGGICGSVSSAIANNSSGSVSLFSNVNTINSSSVCGLGNRPAQSAHVNTCIVPDRNSAGPLFLSMSDGPNADFGMSSMQQQPTMFFDLPTQSENSTMHDVHNVDNWVW